LSSDKQINANRINSKKSTGPKTDEGKQTVSKNAIKHGVLSSQTVLPWEDDTELETLKSDLTNSLNPENPLEALLVDRIISVAWRLRRVGRIESGINSWRRYSLKFNAAVINAQNQLPDNPPKDSFKELFEVQNASFSNDRKLKAYDEVAIQSELVNSEVPELGRTFVKYAQTFAILSKYELGLERSLFKALNELQRLQAVRSEKSNALSTTTSGVDS
jgi:hypothetical protein